TESNSPPVIGGTPASQATAGFTYLFQPSAADSDGDSLTFSATGLPSWAAINSQTGLVYGTPTTADIGTTSSIVVRVFDGQAYASLAAFNLAVTAGSGSPPPSGNNAPTISGTPLSSVQAGS